MKPSGDDYRRAITRSIRYLNKMRKAASEADTRYYYHCRLTSLEVVKHDAQLYAKGKKP